MIAYCIILQRRTLSFPRPSDSSCDLLSIFMSLLHEKQSNMQLLYILQCLFFPSELKSWATGQRAPTILIILAQVAQGLWILLVRDVQSHLGMVTGTLLWVSTLEQGLE